MLLALIMWSQRCAAKSGSLKILIALIGMICATTLIRISLSAFDNKFVHHL